MRLAIVKRIETPISASETTVTPATAPERSATTMVFWKFSEQAVYATRALARVEDHMPMMPEAPLQSAPETNEKVTIADETIES
mmetsp:Transcript_122793/g.348023  ORF Transcript_122793/g.348023 Transcript_122793/m.348023 type:complete len:84 (-) Transcript_122793:216-467(-)